MLKLLIRRQILFFGAVIDDNMDDSVRVTVIATGFDNRGVKKIETPDMDIKPFTVDDLDIPAFLRRKV